MALCCAAPPPSPPLTVSAPVHQLAHGYAAEVGNFYYGQGHPMKPHRIRMAHNLLLNYGLYKKMEIYVRSREVEVGESSRRLTP